MFALIIVLLLAFAFFVVFFSRSLRTGVNAAPILSASVVTGCDKL